MTAPPAEEVEAGAVVIGAGIGGLATALALAARPEMRRGGRPSSILLIARSPLSEGAASAWAQGGIAAALGEDDGPALHEADTIAVGCGTNDPEIVRLVTSGARAAIERLEALGLPFDRTVSGGLSFGREAGHSRRRIVHAGGDRIGMELVRVLGEALRRQEGVSLIEGVAAEEILVRDGTVQGLLGRREDGRALFLRTGAVILATGGIGGLYDRTTNPVSACGDGLAMAARAGAVIADAEFVQFHPTALDIGVDPMPLATEALRGEGAFFVDDLGRRLMTDVHADADLAPRDIVARAVWHRRSEGHTVYLDCRAIGAGFAKRFPTVFASCMNRGIDPVHDLVPIAPAAHYHMGGVKVDARGRSTIEGLWACGEVASTGLHGANRLASNSLLEALVFAPLVAADVAQASHFSQASRLPQAFVPPPFSASSPPDDPERTARLRALIGSGLGVVRDGAVMRWTLGLLAEIEREGPLSLATRNRLTVARLVGASALAREESRGSHYRADFPETSEAWRHRTFITLAEADRIAGVAPVDKKS